MNGRTKRRYQLLYLHG